MKKWQWLTALLIFVGVAIANEIGDLAMKRMVHKMVYSSDDLVFMRQAVLSFVKDEQQQIPASADVSITQLQLYETIERFNDGFLLSYEEAFVLNALYDGFIVFTGHTKYNGKSISVIYDNGMTVTYGFVDEFFVLPYTTVQKGDILATKKGGTLYIQVEQDGTRFDIEQTTEWLKGRAL